MVLHIDDILQEKSNKVEFEMTEDNERMETYLGMLPEGITLDADDVYVYGYVKRIGDSITLHLDAEVDYTAPCDRCLEMSGFFVGFGLDRVIVTADRYSDTDVRDDEFDMDGLDLLYSENGTVDLTKDVAEGILLNLPFIHLCDENCRGLCPVCGKKITDENPECPRPKEIDPRMEKIKKILENRN